MEKKQPGRHWLKMSTALLVALPAHAQRISIHLQHLKARLLPRNICPPDSHITPSCNINNSKHNNIRTACIAACEYGQSLVRRRRCKITSSHAESSSLPTSTRRIENVHSIAITTCSRATHQHSSPAPQSAPPSAQHMPPRLPHHTILQYQQLKT